MSAIKNPPKHLSRESKAFWRSVLKDYELEDHHLKLLQAACESWDRVLAARKEIEAKGEYYTDRWDQPRPHPAHKVELDNKSMFTRLIRELALDLEPPKESRPPRQYGA